MNDYFSKNLIVTRKIQNTKLHADVQTFFKTADYRRRMFFYKNQNKRIIALLVTLISFYK